jgi:hypothetical protein
MVGVVLAWIGIGLAASLAAMIWPMRRGVVGIALNMGSGIAGAVLFALLGRAIGAYPSLAANGSYAFAAVGALFALALVHLLIFFGPLRFLARER